MDSLEKQWYKLNWKWAAMLSMMAISIGIGFYLFQKPRVETVVVEKVVNGKGISCKSIFCYSDEYYEIWADIDPDLNFVVQLNVEPHDDIMKLSLRNSLSEIKSIFKGAYQGQNSVAGNFGFELRNDYSGIENISEYVAKEGIPELISAKLQKRHLEIQRMYCK